MDIQALLRQMTLEEKASLCSGADFWHLKGVERLGIPSIMVADGPHGLRKAMHGGDHMGINPSLPATCFPTASLMASTWDRDLIHEVGRALGEECLEGKVAVILGPGANIKRSPLCGRNFEYFSEDPYLAGEMAKNHIQGVQSMGIGTSLKHFAANNQETRRMTINAVIDERALREIYLTAFETAVKESQPWTVMCAYNRLNGEFCSEHTELLTGILKEEWGHEGIVVTDWGAINDRVAGLQAGCELEMPGTRGFNDARIVAAVKSGALDEKVLDQAVERILRMIFRGHQNLQREYTFDRDAHHQFARRVATEGMVLLKNDDSILPLRPDCRVAVIGAFAQTPKFQAYGSSLINPTREENAFDEIQRVTGGRAVYAPGYDLNSDQVNQALIDEAAALAEAADCVVVFAGLTDMYESEGFDRAHMQLPPNHNALIKAVAKANPRAVVVLYNGAPVEMPWIGQVKAVLEGYLAGQAGGPATADILFGKVNPSGKLAETFPLRYQDTPAYEHFPQGPINVEYRESIFVGYRYYDSAQKEVLFPFGHGLSYTSFAYRDIRLSRETMREEEDVVVTFKVKNTGAVAGKEVVQLYVRDPESSVFKPEKELKGFEKIDLDPGEEKEVSIRLGRRAFAFYNTSAKDWTVESGTYEILVGASSRDIRLRASLVVEADTAATLPAEPPEVKESLARGLVFDERGFRALYGRPVPPNRRDPKAPFDWNSLVADLPSKPFGRLIYSYTMGQMERILPISGMKDDRQRKQRLLMRSTVVDLPLRSFATMHDELNPIIVEGMMHLANGHILRAVYKIIQGLRYEARNPR